MNAIGGDIEAFSDVEMSTVGTAGGNFGPAGGGGGRREGPSRVIKARLRFVGRRAGAGGAGWAEVEVSDWESERGDDGTKGLEYDRVNGESTGFNLNVCVGCTVDNLPAEGSFVTIGSCCSITATLVNTHTATCQVTILNCM